MGIDTSTAHPNPVPNPHHRKIELQSPLDLTYLQRNIAVSARQKLDLHFPPSALQPQLQPQPQPQPLSSSSSTTTTTEPHPPGGLGSGTIDPMRQRVEDLVAQFLDRMWRGARQNISINGQDATAVAVEKEGEEEDATTRGVKGQEEREGVDFEYEAYDARLSGRVAGLYAELEALTMQVSRLRRTAPRTAAERYAEALMGVLEQEEVRGGGGGEGEGGVGVRAGLRLEGLREEDVAAVYECGLAELGRLGGAGGEGSGSSSLTETVGKVQRAKAVALELE